MATPVSGREALLGIKRSATWGTASTIAANCALNAEWTTNPNLQRLPLREIGSGRTFTSTVVNGNMLPSASLAGDAGYGNNFDLLLALLFGTAPAPSEAHVGQGDYVHTITWADAVTTHFATVAQKIDSATVKEMPTAQVSSVTVSCTSGVPGVVQYSAELLGNDLLTVGATNTTTALGNATFRDTTPIVLRNADYFAVNAQGGAGLAGGDKFAVVGFSVTYQRPLELVSEARGTAGVSAPTPQDLCVGTLELTIKSFDSTTFDFYNEFRNENAFKANLLITGSAIGTGFRSLDLRFPSLKLNEATPNLTAPGRNPFSLKFEILEAASLPTGMTSKRPYIALTNTQTTSLLA